MNNLTDGQQNELVRATEDMIEIGEDLTLGGKPELPVLRKQVNFKIDGADRDAAFATATGQGDGGDPPEPEEEVYRPASVEEGYGEADTEDQKWKKFVRDAQAAANADGMREAHHPDLHYLGADAGNCPNCDSSLPSLRAQYEA